MNKTKRVLALSNLSAVSRKQNEALKLCSVNLGGDKACTVGIDELKYVAVIFLAKKFKQLCNLSPTASNVLLCRELILKIY